MPKIQRNVFLNIRIDGKTACHTAWVRLTLNKYGLQIIKSMPNNLCIYMHVHIYLM